MISGYTLSVPIAQNKDLKVKYRLLDDIVSKTLLAKAEAFDKITTEKFLVMATIASKLNVNLSDIIINFLLQL